MRELNVVQQREIVGGGAYVCNNSRCNYSLAAPKGKLTAAAQKNMNNHHKLAGHQMYYVITTPR